MTPAHTGLHDKTGREIKLGDRIQVMEPYRETQDHWVDIGMEHDRRYTESMEPEIRTVEYVVQWGHGMFYTHDLDWDCEDAVSPLCWAIKSYRTTDDLISAFCGPHGAWEEDLEYLLEQYPPNTEEELLAYLSGVEIIEPAEESQ